MTPGWNILLPIVEPLAVRGSQGTGVLPRFRLLDAPSQGLASCVSDSSKEMERSHGVASAVFRCVCMVTDTALLKTPSCPTEFTGMLIEQWVSSSSTSGLLPPSTEANHERIYLFSVIFVHAKVSAS